MFRPTDVLHKIINFLGSFWYLISIKLHTTQQYDSANWILHSSEEQNLLSWISNSEFSQLV